MSAYYCDSDPFVAEWLRRLIAAGLIAPGEVDERSIADVRAGDLAGFEQCHFFAGIGGWSLALRLAGWPDGRPCWTASCPCQPFSEIGAGCGIGDARHLWPELLRLARELRPLALFGEQVANRGGLAWLDHVSIDLEGEGYAFGAAITCAAGFGAPHRRSRAYFVASAVGDAERARLEGFARNELDADERGWLAGQEPARPTAAPSAVGGFWRGADWLSCRDGKERAVEPGTFPLAHGAAARVGRLRAYGNAICAPQASAFVSAFMELRP